MARNKLSYQAQLSRHDHDVSAGYAASLVPGAIVPQYFDILNPGDSIYYRTHMFARMQDVITAFIGEVDIHLDYFFVPLQMLYTPFGQVFAQTNDFLSSLYAGEMVKRDSFPMIYCPAFDNRTTIAQNGIPEFECDGKSVMRLLDAFDMNPQQVIGAANAAASAYTKKQTDISDVFCANPSVAPWIPLAYQAIYQKYYRSDDLENLDVAAYNIDHLYNDVQAADKKYFKLHYHQRPSDYFTTCRVSPIASAVNSFATDAEGDFNIDNGGSLDNMLLKVEDFLSPSPNGYSRQKYASAASDSFNPNSFDTTSVLQTYQKGSSASYAQISAANIRALFAVDKFARIYGRADKTYDDQILAHFGVHIPHDVKHDLTHLKHYRAVLQADPIYGTANTQNSGSDLAAADAHFIGTIGQVGGQGQVTLDSDQEKFTAPVHGVFMCVAYVLTKPRYTETFSKLHLATNRLAFPIPEYDKLGAQPLYGFEFSRYYLQPTDQQSHNFRGVRRAWQNRYQEWKEKYNRSSILYEEPAEQSFVPSSSYKGNIYAPWMISHAPFYYDIDALASSYMLDVYKFYQNPHALDGVMVRPYVSGWSNDWFASPWLALQSDPILTDYMCFAKKVSWMSETGEPDL